MRPPLDSHHRGLQGAPQQVLLQTFLTREDPILGGELGRTKVGLSSLNGNVSNLACIEMVSYMCYI